jgi:hypothetical protein
MTTSIGHRRALFGFAVVALAILALLTGPGLPAQAAPAAPGAEYKTANDYCHLRNWAGTFYCGTLRTWTKADTYPEVFVIGADRKVYTRWSNSTTLYDWSGVLGGNCDPNDVFIMSQRSDEIIELECTGSDGNRWYIHRAIGGGWTPWMRA